MFTKDWLLPFSFSSKDMVLLHSSTTVNVACSEVESLDYFLAELCFA
jgi:hypothetical protein